MRKERVFFPYGCPWLKAFRGERHIINDFRQGHFFPCCLIVSPGSRVAGEIIELDEGALEEVKRGVGARLVDFGGFVAWVIKKEVEEGVEEWGEYLSPSGGEGEEGNDARAGGGGDL